MKNEFSQLFDIGPEIDYLNTGTLSFVPRKVMAAHIEELKAYEKNPTINLFDGWAKLWNVQKKIAGFFKGQPKDFFLRHNVTGAMNDFIMGVRLRPGPIAVTNLEYGAISNICRFRCEKDGRQLITINIPEEKTIPSEEFLVENILSQLPADTAMVMLSHVMTGTGLKIPLKKLSHELRKRDVVLAVDGAHAPGALKVDLSQLPDLHFYGGNLHKWLLGPKGTGFGWVPSWFQDQVEVVQAGWTTFEIPVPFMGFGDGDRFATRMLMSNCLNFPTFFALGNLIDWWSEVGEEKVFQRLEDLRRQLEANAVAKKWEIVSPSAPKLKSPLLALRVKPEFSTNPLPTMRKVLEECKVQIAMAPWRGDFVMRLSAHIYSDETRFEEVFHRLDFLRA